MADAELIIKEFIAIRGLDYIIELFGYDPRRENTNVNRFYSNQRKDKNEKPITSSSAL